MSRRLSCLTCRSRKAKCDRLLPRCSTCVKLDRPCLTPERKSEFIWLHSGVGELSGYGLNFEDGHQNRGFKFSSGRDSLLSNDERARHTARIISSASTASLDAILEHIDVQSRKVKGTTISHGPFGVFQLECQTQTELEEPGFVPSGNRKERPAPAEGRDPDDLDLSLEVDKYQGFDLDPKLWEDDQILLEASQEDFLDMFLQEYDDYFSTNLTTADEHPSSSILSMPTTFATDFYDLDMKSIGHLLDRYRNSLITSFLPVQKYHTSPWEFIHVPKVHEALGEAMISGEATHPKMGLFFAVLSASAFHLHAQTRSTAQVDQTWKLLGEEYRSRARTRLRLSLANLSTAMAADQVADIVLALTSMYTICVVSAQLEDTYVYLREINRLVAIYGMELSRISTTLRILQNIFYYIQTMQDTVGVFSGEKLIHSPLSRTRQPPPIETSVSIPDTYLHNDCNNSQSLFERVFSIPPSLFGLISRVTALIHETERIGINEAKRTDPALLADRVNQLETEIWDWTSTPNNGISPSPTTCLHGLAFLSPDSANHDTDSPLHHYIEAMHSAVLIYFYRCIRKVDPLMIQHFADKTIDSLTQCTELRQKTHDPSSDICWPLFIAGCESLNPSTRKRVRYLFAIEAARTGIRMFEKACQATVEVWAVRDRSTNRHLSWSVVLRESNMLDGLMIS